MAYKLMIQGTAKGAGKSFIVAGILRAFSELGFKVCPFKTVEVTTDTFVTKEGAEISKQMATLSFAASTEPSVYMNPIVLKPADEENFHVLVNGELKSNMTIPEFLDSRTELWDDIKRSIAELEKEYDIIIFEGDRSPAELDLKENDISNMGLAKMYGIPTIIVGDNSLGGVLASLHGTIDFLPYEEKRLIKGVVINNYSAKAAISEKSIKQLEARCGKKVLGRIPTLEIDPFTASIEVFLNKEKPAEEKKEETNTEVNPIDVAVIKLPRISHYPEFEPLEKNSHFNVRYVKSVDQLKTPELLVIPGTKSTIPDLRWLKAMGFSEAIKNLPKSTRILGICGGFQMLGREVVDPYYVEGGGTETGLSLLPIRTTLREEKTARPAKIRLVNMPKTFDFLEKVTVSGQEVNGGEMEVISDAVDSRTFGTYIHGFFESESVIKAFERGFERLATETNDFENYRELQFDKCGQMIDSILDLDELEIIMGMKKK